MNQVRTYITVRKNGVGLPVLEMCIYVNLTLGRAHGEVFHTIN